MLKRKFFGTKSYIYFNINVWNAHNEIEELYFLVLSKSLAAHFEFPAFDNAILTKSASSRPRDTQRKVGHGKMTLFWWDSWIASDCLKNLFLRLFSISLKHNKHIANMRTALLIEEISNGDCRYLFENCNHYKIFMQYYKSLL